jgi:hypothetical protein
MGMTIDLAIKVLKRMIRKGIAYDDGYAFEPLAQDEEKACSIAIDTMNSHQMMQADYENRLKADLKAILVELQLEIEGLRTEYILADYEEDINTGIEMAADAIQEKINELDGEHDPTPQI